MNYQDFLLTFAQIAGVIVGFANLATAFDGYKGETNWQMNRVRILVITESGMIMIATCFIPYLVFFFNGDETATFKISSKIALALFMGNTLFSSYRFYRYTGKLGFAQIALNLTSLIFACGPLMIASFAQLSLHQIIAVYCSSVFSVFFVLSIIFVRLFRNIV